MKQSGMNQTLSNAQPPHRARLVLAGSILMALGVLAATLIWAALNLRGSVTTQIENRAGEILDSVAAAQYWTTVKAGMP